MLKNYWPDNEQTFNDFVDRDEVLIYYSDLNDLNIEYVEKKQYENSSYQRSYDSKRHPRPDGWN